MRSFSFVHNFQLKPLISLRKIAAISLVWKTSNSLLSHHIYHLHTVSGVKALVLSQNIRRIKLSENITLYLNNPILFSVAHSLFQLMSSAILSVCFYVTVCVILLLCLWCDLGISAGYIRYSSPHPHSYWLWDRGIIIQNLLISKS